MPLLAQDSLSRATQTAPPGAIVRPLEYYQQQQNRPRKRRLTAADSARIAAQRDSVARAQQAAAGNSAFNIGQPAIDSAALLAQQQAAVPQAAQAIPEVPMLTQSDNPFDILRGGQIKADTTPNQASAAVNIPTEAPSLLDKQTLSKNFFFFVFVILLLLMVFIVPTTRSTINNAYGGLLSDVSLKQIYRDPVGWGNLPYMALYSLFWINGGIFIFLLTYHYNIRLPFNQVGNLFICIGGIILVFLLKHLILFIIAIIFPVEKEIRAYNFVILIGGILLGLLLTPFNMAIAFGSENLGTIAIWGAFGLIGLIYLIRSFRAVAIASPYLITNRFHFLVYLCTVEIAPIMILVKMLLLNK